MAKLDKQKAIKAKVKELQGWFDGGKIRFPTVHAKETFEKWRSALDDLVELTPEALEKIKSKR